MTVEVKSKINSSVILLTNVMSIHEMDGMYVLVGATPSGAVTIKYDATHEIKTQIER